MESEDTEAQYRPPACIRSFTVLVLLDDGLCSRNFYTPVSDSVQYLFSQFLKALVDGTLITCCGIVFQLLATLTAKNIL